MLPRLVSPVAIGSLFAAFATALVGFPRSAGASDAVQTVTIVASVESQTSLRLSSPSLRFEVAGPVETATASVDYTASARTRSGGEVILSLEPGHVDGLGGAAGVETTVTLVNGEGARRSTADPIAAARWVGSGTRAGRLTFSLRAATPGTYIVPVSLLLTAP